MIEIVIGIVLLVVALGTIKWLISTEPARLLRVGWIVAGGLLALLAVFLFMREKIYFAIPVMLVALGLIRGWLPPARVGGGRAKGGGRVTRGSSMTASEAYEILGLEPGASPDEIKAAHRRLVAKIHPDHGGSDYLTTKINQAKDCLLKE
jgi:hypothetical protein